MVWVATHARQQAPHGPIPFYTRFTFADENLLFTPRALSITTEHVRDLKPIELRYSP